jgi:hypothetical protein|tara:strand:+ start:1063 stop:1461 length:399 start_codon:yes stop_codon:yes gene_type:complete
MSKLLNAYNQITEPLIENEYWHQKMLHNMCYSCFQDRKYKSNIVSDLRTEIKLIETGDHKKFARGDNDAMLAIQNKINLITNRDIIALDRQFVQFTKMYKDLTGKSFVPNTTFQYSPKVTANVDEYKLSASA